MKEAVIVSAARTPIGAYRAIDDTEGPTLAAHAVRAAVERAASTRGAWTT
ncbi:MAG: hypothetical protein U5K76_08010 [Woeseiaceae bacterium]|nr:hypothetical protein [Woeseiaceae bacterium]